MKFDPIRPAVLAVRVIPNVDPAMAATLGLDPSQKSLGLLSSDCDDVAYTAFDEATKKADVKVVYAKSMYAGAANASTKLAGEFLGILAGPNPAEVRSGLSAAVDFIENDACFYSANDDDTVPFYAHTISRTGSYLSGVAGVEEGEALAYCIAPPLEAMYAIDAALKAADVKLVCFYGPPTETNFGGGLMTGSQSACKAACDAFRDAVVATAAGPTDY
jgi:ethanolamine utilization protein EutL